jgi:hypothetical protein
MSQSRSRTGDLTTSAGKQLLTAARKGAISAKRMSEGLMAAGAVARDACSKYRRHPREGGEPVFRAFMFKINVAEYWVARSSRAMTPCV